MTSPDELMVRVGADLEQAGWQPGRTIVAAVSGGPDSMALLHLLRGMAKDRPMRIVAAHFNHRFRGEESDAEEALVRRTAREWGVEFVSASVDMPAYIEETGMNAQAASREKRYAFLRETARTCGAEQLMLAHHADDQAETVLMRVLRGTGVSGLAGIPFCRRENNLELIRPLLRITKQEILNYCKRNGVPYALDSSNLSRRYFRNAVRLDLIPHLESYNPRLKESLVRLADMAAADDAYLEAEAEKRLSEIAVQTDRGFRVDLRGLRGLHIALQRRLIKLILKCSSSPWDSLEYRQIEEMLSAVADERKAVHRMDLGDGKMFIREYDEIYIGRQEPEQPTYRYPVTGFPCIVKLKSVGAEIRFERWDAAVNATPKHRWEAYFDESALDLPLSVRNRKPGDRMAPDGLNGTKKVHDMFIDAKIPRSKRDQWPLIEDASGRILWLPGLRRSGHARVEPGTASIIRIAVISGENPEDMGT